MCGRARWSGGGAHGRVFEHDHVLGERVGEREEGALGVEPRVGAELLVVGL